MNKFSIMIKAVTVGISFIGVANSAIDSPHNLLKSWTGVYVGMNAGFTSNNVQLKSQQLGFTNPSELCNTSANFSTFFPGFQLGYMYQLPTDDLVAGIETNITLNAKQNNTLSCICDQNLYVSDRFSFKNQMQNSIKVRGGRSLNWKQNILLPYLTTGVSLANTGLTYNNEGGDYYSKNSYQSGWLIGAGVEWSLSHHCSLRAEYSYIDYGNIINLKIPSVYGLVDPYGNARVNLKTNSLLVGINFWI